MGRRPAGMRSGSPVDTPDNYVLGFTKMSCDFGPAVVQIFLTKLAANRMQRISLSSKRVRRILIIYFQLIYQIVETDINVSAAQPTQGRTAEKISGTLTASGNVHSVFCQIVAYNFQLRPRRRDLVSAIEKGAGIFKFVFR